MYGIKVNTETSIDGGLSPLYDIGDTVSLMLQVDYDDVVSIGDTLQLEIRDLFGNVIESIDAELIGDVYVAEWTIPLSIHKTYNALGAEDTSPMLNFYYLYDNWIFPDNTTLAFEFLVERAQEQPVDNNCMYTVTISGITSDTNNLLDDYELKFTSILTPFYATPKDIKNVYSLILNDIDDFDITREILSMSEYVDIQMRPEEIYRQTQYDNAVRSYVTYETARILLNSWLNINAENKKLDMLEYGRKSGDPDRLLKNLEEYVTKFSKVIWAGGNDTPFIPRTFTKGVFDPNRVNANRVALDISDPYPWVNTTTQNFVTEIEGNTVELRGTRTVSFLKNRSSFPNIYLRSEGLS
jgi:hypothetical protein